MDDGDATPWGASDLSIGALLDQRAQHDAGYPYALAAGREISVGQLAQAATRAANGFSALGLGRGDRVCVMLDNDLDHVVVFFALLKLGACMVPINVHLRGDGLRFILEQARPKALIADVRFAEHLDPLTNRAGATIMIWRGRPGRDADLADVLAHPDRAVRPCPVAPDDVVAIMFTSGTTGLPKGVLVSDRMLRCAAHGAARLTRPRAGDVFHFWEPLYHIGGSEVLVLALQHRITLAMVPRFDVAAFWSDARRFGATHVHFLGGVLALLLKQPPRPDDRNHGIRLAWGGGCPPNVWREFEERFGVRIHDAYGMTEASSFTTQNLTGKAGSVGRPVPWFDVAITDDDGRALGPNQRGEFRVRERVPGLLTKGYFENPDATAALWHGEWLCTGDVGYYDDDGDFHLAGRKKDSIRRRGENISAFEIERIANEHPDVAESGVVGVPDPISDEDVKIFLRLRPGAALDPLDFIRWAETRMAYFQVPRYVAFIDQFPKTPSERIRKDVLPRTTAGVFDVEQSGHRVKRD